MFGRGRIRSAKPVAAVAVGVAAVLVVGGGTAAAKTYITGADVKNGSLHVVDLSSNAQAKLKGSTGTKGATGAHGFTGAAGSNGKDGKDGKDATFTGAYYSVAYYDVGDTNSGAIATAACSHVTDTAISGGVQTLGLGESANSRNTPVSSSFPGRMDWDTNAPKADRLDGWIVQFGGNAGATSDKAPEKVKIYALCVPRVSVPVVRTYTQSD